MSTADLASLHTLSLNHFPGVSRPVNRVWTLDDGGRAAAGYTGGTGDCVVRAIAIAAKMSYQDVYDAINRLAARERPGSARRQGRRSSARTGVFRATYQRLLEDELGWRRTTCMTIGSGCKVHLRRSELPQIGALVVRVSKHLTAVVDGMIRDTHDPSRGGTRAVYCYWSRA